jgi:hypothetical protein
MTGERPSSTPQSSAALDVIEDEPPMIGFNYLLQSSEVDPARTKLVRHQDNRARSRGTPYGLWMASDGRFEMYQRIQGKDRFRGSSWVASFVATPLDETLFVGVYRVGNVGTAPTGTLDPLGGQDVTGHFLYDLEPDTALQEYIGRIVIDWGAGFRAWVQRADNQDKSVLEIRRTAIEPPFPGFTSFSWSIRELASVPSSWRGALSAIGGVYLLVCRSTGKQYVGSAYGTGGFWARWENYFRTGHGGNEGMKLVPGNDYQVSILEFASSSLSFEEIVAMETRWKEKLLTRTFGLNRN